MEPALPEPAASRPEKPGFEQVPAEKIESFSRELAAVGGFVYVVGAAELAGRLSGFLRERSIEHIQMWAGIPGLEWDDLVDFDPVPGFQPQAQAGITGALAGIAETGTLVLPAGGDHQPLSASLLPAIHIAVLPASRLLTSLEQVMRLPQVASAPATVLITGPSRTADIEMTLTIGVHGPKELHVFLVDDEAIK